MDRFTEEVSRAVAAGDGYTAVVRAARVEGRTTMLRRLSGRFLDGRVPGATVFSAVCVPSQSGCRYAALRSLLADVPDALALPPVLAAISAGEQPGDHDEVRRGAWQFLRDCARQAPVLVCVDDAEHIDEDSAAVLGYLGDRTQGRTIGLVMTALAEAPLPPELERLPAIRLPRLSESAVRALLDDRATVVAPAVVTELISLCHGNPLVLREFAATMDEDQLRGRVPLPRRIPLGTRSLRVFSEPWAGLPARTRDWLLVLALGDDNLATCTRAADRLGCGADDLAPAEATGIVRTDRTSTVSWRSALVRSAVTQSANLADTTRTYQALVEVITPETEPVQHAQWLAYSLTEPEVQPATLTAALVALAQDGRLLDAYELAIQASAVASDVAKRHRYRVTAAELCWQAGYSEHALRLLDQSTPRSGDPGPAALVLRWVIQGFRASWTNPLRPPSPGTPGDESDTGQRARSLGTALLAGWETTTPDSLSCVLDRLRELHGHSAELAPETAEALAKVVAGGSGLTPNELGALRSAAEWVYQDDALHPKTWPPPLLPNFIGEENYYAQRFATRLDTPHGQSARSTRTLLLLKLATAQSALGHWPHALRNASNSADLAEELGLRALRSEALTLCAWIYAAQGDESRCRAHLGAVYQQEGRRPAGRLPFMVQWLQGLLALSVGRPAEAYERLRPLHTGETESPHHLVIKRLSTADFVTAAISADHPREAQRCTAQFRRWVGEGVAAWAELDLARCQALVNADEAEHWYELALERTAGVGRLATTARVELSYGSWLRRGKRHREARPHLRLADQYFDKLEASAWRERAHAELRATGETGPADAPHSTTLTAQELQVARFAAEGKTNREIAAAMALSSRTVGYHLYKIFPKLDITSRAQLPNALRDVDEHEPH